jgi:DNA-binding NtrC family response regulator
MDILIVDDDADVAELFCSILRSEGHNVLVAYDGESALELVRRLAFAIVISDVRMPKLNGFALVRGIKDARPDTRVILVTGFDDSAEAGRLSRDVETVLEKPVDVEALLAAVNRLMEDAA